MPKVKIPTDHFSFSRCHQAFLNCRQGKRKSLNCLKFELNLESELASLEHQLQTHQYKPGQSICFVIMRPKLREIFAADFRDRVVHHLLHAYLNPIFEQFFISNSFACRTGKGTHNAARALRSALTINHYYLKADIQGYFTGIDHQILYGLINKRVHNPEILWLTKRIIETHPTSSYRRKGDLTLFGQIPTHKSLFHTSKTTGLPIGNLTSQFFANVYLNELDQFVKHELKVRYYFRYVDDFILLSQNQDELKDWLKSIDRFLKKALKLKLHPTKQTIGMAKHGIDFVGYTIFPTHLLCRKRIVHDFRKRLVQFNKQLKPRDYQATEDELRNMLAVINSYYAHFCQASTFHLRQRLWEQDFQLLQHYFKPVDQHFSHFVLLDDSKKTNYRNADERI